MAKEKIYEALQCVQEYMVLNPIAKEGVNNYQKYNYRGIDQIIQSFSKPLFENKILTIVQPGLNVSTKFIDGKNTLTRVVGTLRFLCTEDGSFIDRSYVGHSLSQQAKDLEAARSFAYRNALLETFCVPFEGVVEPEMEGVDKDSKPEADQEEVSIIEDFKTQLRKVYKDKEKALKLFQQYDKVAELSNDKETRVQLNLLYSKVVK
ncbi:ERF family protein [Candidatus Poseidoniales archaeon]|jgi:hypothetical protein|nr:ERF family protein [Candidatus Poseidoniales archaeon]